MHFTTSDGRQWVLNSQDDWIRFFQYAAEHPEDEMAQWMMNEKPGWTNVIQDWFNDWNRQRELLEQAETSGDWNSFYRDAAHEGLSFNDEVEKYVDNQIAQANTQQAQNWEQNMRDTSYLSAGSQLLQLGLSPSTVVQTGAASSNGVAAADNAFGSTRMNRQRLAMQKYQTRMSMAKGLLGMVGQMVSSGIYGSAIGAAKKSAAALSAASAHSGLQALKTSSGRSYADVINGMNNKW